MLICGEVPVAYRKDVALEDAWYGEVGTGGFEPHLVYCIKTSSMVFGVVAVVVIRQYALKNYLWRMLLGANGK